MYLAAQFFLIFGWLVILGIILLSILVLGIVLLVVGIIAKKRNRKKGIEKKYPKICTIVGSVLTVIPLVILGFFLVSYMIDAKKGEYNPDTYDPHESSLGQDIEYTKNVCAEVIRCLDEGDSECLEQLFSEYSIEISDLDADIEEAMEIYSGDSVSYDFSHSGGAKDVSDGYYSYKSSIGYMDNLVTDTNAEYYIEVIIVLVSDDETEKEGIKTIEIMDPNNQNETLIRIGKYY